MFMYKLGSNTLLFTLAFIFLQYKYYFYIIKIIRVVKLCIKQPRDQDDHKEA